MTVEAATSGIVWGLFEGGEEEVEPTGVLDCPLAKIGCCSNF